MDDGEFHYNLISSRWADWRHMTINNIDEDLMPKIKTADGCLIPCHGYVVGTWTDFLLEYQYRGLMLFVVDASFYLPGCDVVHNFVLNGRDLKMRKRQPSKFIIGTTFVNRNEIPLKS